MDHLPLEAQLAARGYRLVAGVDEAGRGPLAGPVVAAAVITHPGDQIPEVRDSKLLTPRERERLYSIITSRALSWGIGIVGARRIEEENILQAALRAMKAAVQRLCPIPEIVLVDGIHEIPIDLPQLTVKKGDAISPLIAAASIVAKVTRDRLMRQYHRLFPQYDFASNKGYPTQAHREAIARYGCCKLHRRTFRGVREYIVQQDS